MIRRQNILAVDDGSASIVPAPPKWLNPKPFEQPAKEEKETTLKYFNKLVPN